MEKLLEAKLDEMLEIHDCMLSARNRTFPMTVDFSFKWGNTSHLGQLLPVTNPVSISV